MVRERLGPSSPKRVPEHALPLGLADTDTRLLAEVTGPPDSGRTRTLLRLHECVPDSVFLDATGLTCEDLILQLVERTGRTLPARRSDWAGVLADSAVRGGLVVIANTQRAGRTRRSAEPDRMVHRFAVQLAVAGRCEVVLERNLADTRKWHGNKVMTLQPVGQPESAAEHPAAEDPGDAGTDALRALALAEVRRTPYAVWSALAQALGRRAGRPVDVTALLRSTRAMIEVDADDCVSFRDERVAEALRRTTEPGLVRDVNRDVVEWLGAQPVTGTTGRYLVQGLAMHVVQADEFDSVQRRGRLAAHPDQVALIDAAQCDDAHPVRFDSPAGDAVNLWTSGVDSLSQGEWASWLHLTSTARGDRETAAEIAACGLDLPWKVRWARWRSPGAMDVRSVRPGPLHQLAVAGDDYRAGRTAVVARGGRDERYRVWDAATGEELAGPWPEGSPVEPGHPGRSGVPTRRQRSGSCGRRW
ncbi:hypothetical protein GCM10023220_42610 [Streptomyces ziwulingensis]|uniref:Uncharacterized protein n=1 Tax=Streptomyces ziwulingensis TaxID=1045501 RepID=A0ABP9CCA4_9ACTN